METYHDINIDVFFLNYMLFSFPRQQLAEGNAQNCKVTPTVSSYKYGCVFFVNVLLVSSLSPAAAMKSSSKVTVQVFFLLLVVQVTLTQHWSYGWLPGGKRSVGELEATIRVNYPPPNTSASLSCNKTAVLLLYKYMIFIRTTLYIVIMYTQCKYIIHCDI